MFALGFLPRAAECLQSHLLFANLRFYFFFFDQSTYICFCCCRIGCLGLALGFGGCCGVALFCFEARFISISLVVLTVSSSAASPVVPGVNSVCAWRSGNGGEVSAFFFLLRRLLALLLLPPPPLPRLPCWLPAGSGVDDISV